MSKLQEKPSAHKREHPALQNVKLFMIFARLDPDPDPEPGSGSGSTDLIEPGFNPKHCFRYAGCIFLLELGQRSKNSQLEK
jgi:hypothetical protein